jgi:protein-tyrosine-phosphatase
VNPRPSAVLFACNLNRVRSPLAAALARGRYGGAMLVESCGLQPADTVDPFVVAVADELGLDISDHEPKDFEAVQDTAFDLVISLTPEAHERALALMSGRSTEVEYWPVSDPTLVEGARDQRIEAYRQTRDEIDRRLYARFGSPTAGDG